MPSVDDVVGQDDILAAIHENRAALFSPTDAPDLSAVLKARNRLAPLAADPGADSDVIKQWAAIGGALFEAGEVGRLVLATKSYRTLVNWSLPIAGVAVVVCAMIVAAVTSRTEARDIVPETALHATIFLNAGVDARSIGLGRDCKDLQLDGVIVGGTLDRPVAALPPQHGESCAAAQFRLNKDIGVAVPTPP